MSGRACLLDEGDRFARSALVQVGDRDGRALLCSEHGDRPAVAHRRVRVVTAPGATADDEQSAPGEAAAHACDARGARRPGCTPSGQPDVSGSRATPTLLSKPDTRR